ncbi:hypothetical protein NFI96_032503, partial [Prochilodus magdalenae]
KAKAEQVTPKTARFVSLTVSSEAIMISYSIIVSLCLLGMASAQNVTSCLTKENYLQAVWKLDVAITKCTCMSEGKVVATTDPQFQQDNTYKNRGTVEIQDKICKLTLNGFSSDGPKTFNCSSDKAKSPVFTAEKAKLPPCSACDILRLGGVTLLLALLASLMSERL